MKCICIKLSHFVFLERWNADYYYRTTVFYSMYTVSENTLNLNLTRSLGYRLFAYDKDCC